MMNSLRCDPSFAKKVDELQKSLNHEMLNIGSSKRFSKREVTALIANRTNGLDLVRPVKVLPRRKNFLDFGDLLE